MKQLNLVLYLFIAIVVNSLLASCSFRSDPVLLKLDELPNQGKVCRIAVLPLANQTDYPLAGTILSRIFTSELTSTGRFTVSQEGDVRKILSQMQVISGRPMSVEQIRSLADRLGVDVVISGSVIEMRDTLVLASKHLDPSLAVIVRILEADSGRTLWTTYNRREGRDYRIIMHFGMINTVAELAQRLSREIIDEWHDEGVLSCKE